jgi:hypothetical protein
MHVEIEESTFVDCNGIVRSFSGCAYFYRGQCISLIEEVHRYAEQLELIGDTEESGADRLLGNPRIVWAITRILELNGIKPEWVSWRILQALVIAQVDPETGAVLPAALLVANQLKERPKKKGAKEGKPQSLPEMIAAVSHSTGGDVDKAVELFKKYPADFIFDLMEALADQLIPQEEKDKAAEEERKAAAKADFQQQLKDPNSPFAKIFGNVISNDRSQP